MSAKIKTVIREYVEKELEIDIEFPYYYQHDLSGDNNSCVCYGKITKDIQVSIQKSDDFINGDASFELEIEVWDDDGCYFQDKYKSSKESFEDIKKQALEFLNKL